MSDLESLEATVGVIIAILPAALIWLIFWSIDNFSLRAELRELRRALHETNRELRTLHYDGQRELRQEVSRVRLERTRG